MRWLGILVGMGMGAIPSAGCGDDPGPFGLAGTTSDDPPPPMVDYDGCEEPMQDPTCEGVACGLTPEAQHHLQIMLDVVEDAGYGSEFSPTKAEYSPFTNVLSIDYQLQVSWFRLASSIELGVPQTDELLRQELAAHVHGWNVPTEVVAPEALSAAVEGCHALLAYDPCTDDHVDFVARSRYDWEQPGCVYKTTYAVVDARDARLLECVVEQELPCQ